MLENDTPPVSLGTMSLCRWKICIRASSIQCSGLAITQKLDLKSKIQVFVWGTGGQKIKQDFWDYTLGSGGPKNQPAWYCVLPPPGSSSPACHRAPGVAGHLASRLGDDGSRSPS